jgi:beta-mannanase
VPSEVIRTFAPATGHGVAHEQLVPSSGAYVGAWVRPEHWTEQGRLDAVAAYEQSLQRPLNIVQTFHTLDDPFPTASDRTWLAQGRQLLISWNTGDIQAVAAGTYDALLLARARAVKALGVPVWIRWRWEMNRPNLAAQVHGPADYVAAWKHVRAIFSSVGATNAVWVWCPLAKDFSATDAAAYYPGDASVDWLCTDVYAGSSLTPFATTTTAFFRFARHHPRPIMIGELGVAGTTEQRIAWLTGALGTVRADPQVKAVVYFESSGGANPTLDTSLMGDPAVLATYSRLVRTSYFSPRP